MAGITGSTTTSGGECERLRDDLEELLFKLLDTHELLQECVSQTDDPDSCAEYFDAWVLLTIAHAEAYAAWSGCGDGPL